MFKQVLFIISILLIGAVSIFGQGDSEYEPIVDVTWLNEEIDSGDLRIIEFGRSWENYLSGHIPGAVWVDLESFRATEFVDNWDLLEVEGDVPGMLPPIDYLADIIESAGISQKSKVVIYDDRGSLWASYLFWVLEYTGHEDVHVLSGGIDSWKSSGGTLSTEAVDVDRAKYTVKIQDDLIVTKEYILENLNNPEVSIVDVRSEGEYTGEILRSARGGHIPGALNLSWKTALVEESNTFKSSEDLSDFYQTVGVSRDSENITHCQEGIRAAHTYLALKNLGYENVKVYDGSWFEWGNDSSLPIEQGL